MGIWFRKTERLKWHLACYGGSLAECGRDVHIAACYAKERMNLDVDDRDERKDLCQACINSILRSREYMKQLEEEYKKHNDSRRNAQANAIRMEGITPERAK